MNRWVLFWALFLFHAPSVVMAFGLEQPHWFGAGAGVQAGKTTRAVGVFTAGRLWTEQIGSGGMVVYPLDGVENGDIQVTAAATMDAFFYQGRSHLAALIGASDIKERDEVRFTAGFRFDWNVPLSGNMAILASASPLWIVSCDPPFCVVMHGELQFRY